MKKFRRALKFAEKLHEHQKRKGTEIPYISHLIGVAAIALEFGANEDQAVAALLHDAVEDQGGLKTLKKIRSRFGDKVARIVADCTDAETIPKPPWRARKEKYIAHLKTISAESRLVSASDKLYNAMCILKDLRLYGAGVWERFSGGKEGSLWYYQELARVFAECDGTQIAPVTQMLQAVVRELVAAAGS